MEAGEFPVSEINEQGKRIDLRTRNPLPVSRAASCTVRAGGFACHTNIRMSVAMGKGVHADESRKQKAQLD